MARDLVGALALDVGHPLHPSRQAGQRRQMADRAQAIEQQRDRAAVAVGNVFAPAVEGAEKGSGAAVAQALLARRAAVDDRAQRFGDRLRRRPRQAHQLAPHGRHAVEHARRVGVAERRLAGEQAMQQHAARQHIALGEAALVAQRRRIERHRAGVGNARRRGAAGLVRDRERHDAGLAAVVEDDVVELQVLVRDAGIVRECQAAQHAADPQRRILDQRPRMLCQPLVEREVAAPLDGDVGPMLVHVAGGHGDEVRVVEARGAAGSGEPGGDRGRRRRRHPRHRQHRLDVAAAVDGEPGHGRVALAEQAAQREAAERSRRRR